VLANPLARSHTKSRVLAAAAVAATLALSGCSSSSKNAAPSGSAATPTTTADIPGVVTYTGLSRNHTTDTVNYPQSPPVGGDHNPVWQNCGVYDTPLINEHAVHALEHGAVWISYKPGLPADQVKILDAFALNQTHILVAPYTGLTDTVVLTAWGKQLRLESVTDPRIAEFVTEYQEGPQTPELGVTCSGGFGNPIS
jgi:hypothetical protein